MKLTRKELIVDLPNEPGALAQVCAILQNENLNIIAIMVRATPGQNRGSLYIISDQPDTAATILTDRGYKVESDDVLCIEIVNRPGSLARLLNLLSAQKINIEYCYVTSHYRGEPTFLILRVNDLMKAVDALQSA